MIAESAKQRASEPPPTALRRIQSARIWAPIQNGMTTSRVALRCIRRRYLMSTMAISTADMTWLTTEASVAHGAAAVRATAVEPATTSAICSRLIWCAEAARAPRVNAAVNSGYPRVARMLPVRQRPVTPRRVSTNSGHGISRQVFTVPAATWASVRSKKPDGEAQLPPPKMVSNSMPVL